MFNQVIRFEWQGEDAVARAKQLLEVIKQNDEAMTSLAQAPAKVERAFSSSFSSIVEDMQRFSRESEAAAATFANAFVDNINRVRASIDQVDKDMNRALGRARQDIPTVTNAAGQQVPQVLIPTRYGGARDASSYTQEDVFSERSASWTSRLADEITASRPSDPFAGRERELESIKQQLLAAQMQAERYARQGIPTIPGVDPMFYSGARPTMMLQNEGGQPMYGDERHYLQQQTRQQYDDWLVQQRLQQIGAGPNPLRYQQFTSNMRAGLPDPFDDFVQQYRGRAPGTDPNMDATAKNVARDDYDRWRQMQLLNQEVERGGKGMDLLNNQWVRFGTYIAVGMVIHSTLVRITNEIQNALNQAVMFEGIANRLAVISGNQPGQNTGAIMDQYATMAQYGVQPDQSGFGLITGMQAGASQTQMQDAARVAQFIGEPKAYTNALQELLQAERQASAAGLDSARVLDYLATAYARVPTNARDAAGAMEAYFDALQSGYILSEKIGMDPYQAGLLIQGTAFGTESNVDVVRTTYERVFSKLIDPKEKTTSGLAAFGIDTTGDPASQIKQIASAVDSLISSGNQARANELLQILFGGTPMQGADLSKSILLIRDLNTALSSAPIPLRDFDSEAAKMADSFQAKTAIMKASWEVLLASLGTTHEVTFVFKAIGDFMEDLSTGIREGVKAQPGVAKYSDMTYSEKEASLRQYVQETGGGSLIRLFDRTQPGLPLRSPEAPGLMDIDNPMMRWASGINKADAVSYQQWLGQGRPEPMSFPDIQGPQPRPAVPDWRTFGPGATPGVENLLNLPSGMGVEDFTTQFQKELKKLQAIPGYTGDEERTGVALMGEKAGETGVYLSTMSVNLQAANNAIRAWKEGVEDASGFGYGGIRELPEGMDFSQLLDRTSFWQGFLNRTVGEENAPVQRQFFIDQDSNGQPVGRSLLASQDALRLALEDLTRVEKQKITGTFNIPAGGEFLVPFFALQSGFVGNDRVPGGGRGSGGGATTDPMLDGTMASGRRGDPNHWARIEERNRLQELSSDAGGRIPGERALPPEFYRGPRPDPRGRVVERERMLSDGGSQGIGNIVIHNRNVIVIDGKIVAQTLNTKMGQSLSSARRGVSGGAGRSMMM